VTLPLRAEQKYARQKLGELTRELERIQGTLGSAISRELLPREAVMAEITGLLEIARREAT